MSLITYQACGDKKNGPNKRTDQSSRKIQLSDEEIANLSEVGIFSVSSKTLTEIVEYSHKVEEKVKAMKSEIKENIQGNNSEGKKTGTQMNDLEQREERNIQPEQSEET